MNKTWLIAKYEYTRHVFRWRFLLVLLSLPTLVLVAVVFAIVAMLLQFDHTPVGYVDQAKIIKIDSLPDEYRNPVSNVKFLPYPSEAAAREALDKKIIQAFFIIPADYHTSSTARIVYKQKPAESVPGQFGQILRINLLDGQTESVTRRVMDGSDPMVIATSDGEKRTSNNLLRSVLPFALSYLVLGSIFTCSGYLVKAVTDERENRTIEILATSVSPGSVMTGKILGLASVGITQMLVWLSLPLVIAAILTTYYPPFQDLVSWGLVGLVLITALPTFLLICTLIAAIGVALGDSSEGQALTGMVTMPSVIPFALAAPISMNPSGPLAVFFSLFPLTAANTLFMRMAFAEIPVWQIMASIGILVLSTAGAFWLAGRVFRRWILGYSGRVNWKGILRKIAPVFYRSGKRAA